MARQGLADALAMLFEGFQRAATPATFKAYAIGLDGLTDVQIRRAVVEAIRVCKFCPSVAELRDLAGVPSGRHRAELAFAALDAAITSHGAYRVVSFDDPLINAAVRLLAGWPRVCALPTEEFAKWYRREFLEVYERLATHGASDDLCRPLPGLPGFSPKVGVSPVATGLPWARSAPGITSGGSVSGLLEVKRP